jgi:hypothetical protein
VKRKLAILCAPVLIFVLVACNQANIAALVSVLGNASASIAALEGNTALAATLQADTAAAADAVKNWKQGTPSQNVIEALNLVEKDLNLLPVNSKYSALIILAIGTAESIIAIVQANNPQASMSPGPQRAHLANPPKTAKEFTARWNAIAQSNPELQTAVIK